MSLFKPIKIKDPQTGEERIVSSEEQESLLERGVFIDLPTESADENSH